MYVGIKHRDAFSEVPILNAIKYSVLIRLKTGLFPEDCCTQAEMQEQPEVICKNGISLNHCKFGLFTNISTTSSQTSNVTQI